MPKASKSKVCNVFYGYSVDEIMRVCCVSKATACHYKRGTRLPSPQAWRLWWLHTQGRILGSSWGFLRVHEDCLVDDAGNRYSEGEIQTLPLLHQKISMLERERELLESSNHASPRDIQELQYALSHAARAIDRVRSLFRKMEGPREMTQGRPTLVAKKGNRFG